MSVRMWASLQRLCLATAAAGLLSPAAAQQGLAPRTPDGHADLQGSWTNAPLTPFERSLRSWLRPRSIGSRGGQGPW